MTIHIRAIAPVTTTALPHEAFIAPMNDSATKVSWAIIERGPESVEDYFDDALSVPDLIRIAMEAEVGGVDALVINCMADPGLSALRQAVSIPVFGAGQVGFHVASMLGPRFSIIPVLKQAAGLFRHLVRGYGLEANLASIRAVNTPVLELTSNTELLYRDLTEAARLAIEEDDTDVIVLGCTGLLGLEEEISSRLAAMGLSGVPIIDPMPAAVHFAAAVVKSRLTHSRKAYARPAAKARPGFENISIPLKSRKERI